MGRWLTTHAKKPKWKMGGPQLNGSRRYRDYKRKTKRLGRILNTNYENSDFEQEVTKLTHITKSQWVTLLGWLKNYKYLFDGNLGKWTGPHVDILLKEKIKTYHKQALPILFIHIEPVKEYLDKLVAICLLMKVNRS